MLRGVLRRGQSFVVPSEAVQEDGADQFRSHEEEPLAARRDVAAAGVDQRASFCLAAAPGGAQKRDVRTQTDARGRRHRIRLGGQCERGREIPDVELDGEPLGEGDGQHDERSGPSREPDMSIRELEPADIIADRPCRPGGRPEPPQGVLVVEPLAPHRDECPAEHRDPGGVAVS